MQVSPCVLIQIRPVDTDIDCLFNSSLQPTIFMVQNFDFNLVSRTVPVKNIHKSNDKFYKGRKQLRNKSTADLGLSRSSVNKIFVSESLSPRNRATFKESLEFKIKYGFKFIYGSIKAERTSART